MNMDRMINMVMRTLMRRAINTGVNKGIDAAAGLTARKKPAPEPVAIVPPEAPGLQPDAQAPEAPEKEKMTPERRAEIRAMRQARRARRAEKEEKKAARASKAG